MKFRSTVILTLILASGALFSDEKADQDLDVPYEPSHPKVVETMLSTGGVTARDVLYDLGCGDGRIVIAAAKKGATAVGADVDEERLIEARERAKAMGVEGRTKFVREDIFKLDISPASIVTMYLLDEVNLQMRPRLHRLLRPGTRIVTHAFNMNDWKPDRTINHDRARDKQIMYWVIPAGIGGTWTWQSKQGQASMILNQKFQMVTGTIHSGQSTAAVDSKIDGTRIQIQTVLRDAKTSAKANFNGLIDADTIKGTIEILEGPGAGKYPWEAKRQVEDVTGKWTIELPGNKALSGVLDLKRDGKGYSAEFTSDKVYAISDLYVWGSSVYFRVPIFGTENPAIYSGTFKGTQGSGNLLNDQGSYGTQWNAKKAK